MGPFKPDHRTAAFDGLVPICLNERRDVAGIESFWDHGGLPLREIHQSQGYPESEFPIESAELRVGPLVLNQSRETLELWFGTGNDLPRDQWRVQEEAGAGVTIWFSQQRARAGWPVPSVRGRAECNLVAGLSLEFRRLVATYPVSLLQLLAKDFK